MYNCHTRTEVMSAFLFDIGFFLWYNFKEYSELVFIRYIGDFLANFADGCVKII